MYNRIADLVKEYAGTHNALIDLSLRWYRGTHFLGQGVDIDFSECPPDSDDEDSDSDWDDDDDGADVTVDDVTVDDVRAEVDVAAGGAGGKGSPFTHAPASQDVSTPISIPRASSSVQSRSSIASRLSVRGSATRVIKVTGPLISTRFHLVLAKLAQSYSRFMRVRLMCVKKGAEHDSCVFIQVYGSSDREREHFAALIHTAVEAFAASGADIRAVNMSVLPNGCLLPRTALLENPFTGSLTFPHNTILPEPSDVGAVTTHSPGSGSAGVGVLGLTQDAVSEDTDVSTVSPLHRARVLLDLHTLQTIGGVLASLDAGSTAHITATPSGFDIASNTENGVATAKVILQEIVKQVAAEFPEA